jgi:multiple sugar transport system substrate-binding protein
LSRGVARLCQVGGHPNQNPTNRPILNRVFFICLVILSATSAALYWTLPDSRSPVPVLYWITQVDTVKEETIAQFKAWRRDQGLPPVEVRIDNVNQDPTKKLAQGLAGVGADILDIYTFETELFAKSGMLMDVTDQAKKLGFGPDATFPGVYSDLMIGGRQYGFPRNAGAPVFWINQDTFARYGVPEPSTRWTWDEFEEIGRKLVTAANPPGTHQRVYFTQMVSQIVLRRGLGLAMFNETMTHCALDDPRNAEVMRRMYRWTTELHLVPTLQDQKALSSDTGRSNDDWFYLYAKGRYAMLYVDRWGLIRMREQGKLRSRVVEPCNSGFPNMEFGCGIIAAYAATKHPKEAVEFLQFLASKPFNLLVARSGDSLPPVPKYTHTDEFLRPPDHPEEWEAQQFFSHAAADLGISYDRSPFVLTDAIYRPVSGIDAQVIDAVLAGQLTPEEAGRVEAARVDAEIALNVRADPKLRQLYDAQVEVQARIDALRAQGRPIPVAWITNPFHRVYYKAKGWLEEEPKS